MGDCHCLANVGGIRKLRTELEDKWRSPSTMFEVLVQLFVTPHFSFCFYFLAKPFLKMHPQRKYLM